MPNSVTHYTRNGPVIGELVRRIDSRHLTRPSIMPECVIDGPPKMI
jgi:hypothetical protein